MSSFYVFTYCPGESDFGEYFDVFNKAVKGFELFA